MSRKQIVEELSHLAALLQQEKAEDLLQYKKSVASKTLSDRRERGVCWYPVQLDKTKYSPTEQVMVRVKRSEAHREAHLFQSGKIVSVFSNKSAHAKGEEHAQQGIVNSVNESEMQITLQCDDEPDWLYDGKLGIQLLFDESSYLEMENGLKILINTPDERSLELTDILLGNGKARFRDRPEMKLPELNESQNLALHKIMTAHDIAIVHGPPGTGKTTTIVQAIVQTLKTETQVLVCAPSNASVDLLAEKIGEHQIDVLRLGNPVRVTPEVLNKTLDAKVLKHPQYKELKMLRRTADECRASAKKYKRNFGPEQRQERRELYAAAKQYRTEARMLANTIKAEVINGSRVILTTLVGATHTSIQNMRFSTVFIDEAAQALEPACWLPILRADRVVLAGDHHQLPPTVKSFTAARNGLSNTLFQKSITRNTADVMLSEQYRMHEDIMGFSSAFFYNNQLKANASVAKWCIVPEEPVVEFIDTSGCGFQEQTHPESLSSFNPDEADLLFRHLENYLQSITTLNLLDECGTVGVISPYKEQVLQLQQLHKDRAGVLPESAKVAVNTIDSFQGQERDMVYISLVRSNDNGQIGFLKDIRRMNVAMTRARKKLVIIGDSATICTHPFYNAFFDYVNENGGYRSAFEFASF